MEPPGPIRELCQALLRGLSAILGAKLYGLYVYGAAAFADSGPTGDLDFHVILKTALSPRERTLVDHLHASLARSFPPLGAELDGYYILLEEARQASPPTHQLRPDMVDASWALHREHIRAGRCIVLHGPDPRQVYPAASWPELEAALFGELEYVQSHLSDYPGYCILNLCRLMYSFQTGDVVISKMAAAAWARDAFPRWRRHIELAKRAYAGQVTPQDKQVMIAEVRGLYRFACERIQQSRAKRRASPERTRQHPRR